MKIMLRFRCYPKLHFLLGLALAACIVPVSSDAQEDAGEKGRFTGFPDFGYSPPHNEYDGALFELSQDYPSRRPSKKEVPEFLKTDVKKNWEQYADQALRYVYEGNIDRHVDWRVERNKTRRWYHMPWQHYGPNGREGIHGLTTEAPIPPYALSRRQTGSTFGVYAVAMYNALGGYTIGRVWEDPNAPDPRATDARYKGGFPVGAVVVKLLFCTVPSEQAKFLENPITWQAYIPKTYSSTQRFVLDVRLLQIDILVRDSQVDDTGGWVFITYAYNGHKKKDSRWESCWDNLVPIGVQWGDDPGVTTGGVNPSPAETRINKDLKQSVIILSKDLPPQHLGWGMRLAGPADHADSSCYSCHAMAESPPLTPISPLFQDPSKVPPIGSDEWRKWFENRTAGVPYDSEALSTDFSLQMSIAIKNFWTWKNQGIQGFWFDEASSGKVHEVKR